MNDYTFEEPMSVEELKEINFDRLSKQEKLRVKLRGRPTPIIQLSCPSKCHGKIYIKSFKEKYFQERDWLCSSNVDNSLYCFPCLLFNKGSRSNFVSPGFRNISCISTRLKEHERTEGHIDSLVSLKLLSKSGIEESLGLAQNKSISDYNKKVKENLEVLKYVIKVLFFLGTHDLPLRGDNEGDSSVNKGVFLDMLDLLADDIPLLQSHLNNTLGSTCKLTSPEIQNEILDSVLQVFRRKVIFEISQANYLAVIADESTDICGQPQLVIVFRYINKLSGQVVERFWGYFCPKSVNAEGISKCILEQLKIVLQENQVKLIAQTFDGAKVMEGKDRGVQARVRNVYKRAHYTDFHQMQLVIKKACEQNQESIEFFENIRKLSSFFNKSVESKGIEKECTGGSLPTGSCTRWSYISRTLTRLASYFNEYKTCFQKISTTSKVSKTAFKAKTFKVLFDSKKFSNLLSFFQPIFSHVQTIFLKLQSVRATADFVNDSFREFREYIEGIEVCDLPIDIQETASEVILKILLELEKRFQNIETGHLVAHQIFRKDFYKSRSDLQLGFFLVIFQKSTLQ